MTSTFSPVLILGARSDVGRALAHRYAAAGATLILAARDATRLADDIADLEVRYGISARAVEFDVCADKPAEFFDRVGETPATVISVVGLLGEQASAELDHVEATRIMETNYVGPARMLNEAARRMESRGSGCIIGISSVAGDRGRASNYVYGSAKAGFTAFLSGLRNRVDRKGITVITVKPGFIATKMTAGMKLPSWLTAQPDEVAAAIFRAQGAGRDVLYVRPIWRLIMAVIRNIPEFLFKRSSI
jgi:decaprenylphospho-beta-D-erythro-pentofuranosid-2-ulose 2-reductase